MTVTALTHDARRSRTTTGLLLALASATTFGMSGPLARGLLDTGWSAGAVVSLRIAIAALVLVVPGRGPQAIVAWVAGAAVAAGAATSADATAAAATAAKTARLTVFSPFGSCFERGEP